MAQAYSKAAKLRNKRAAGLPGLAEVPKRDKAGCFVDRVRQQGEGDVKKTVLSSRCRRLGIAINKANMSMVDDALHGDPAGIAICLVHKNKDTRERLWKVFCDMDRADEVYFRRILGRSRHAKCGRMEYIPERFQADPNETADVRTDDEKDRDAVNNWMRWQGLVGHLGAEHHVNLNNGVYLRTELHVGSDITADGSRFVSALEALNEVVTSREKR